MNQVKVFQVIFLYSTNPDFMLRILHFSYAKIARFHLNNIENDVKKMPKTLLQLLQVSLQMMSALII